MTKKAAVVERAAAQGEISSSEGNKAAAATAVVRERDREDKFIFVIHSERL